MPFTTPGQVNYYDADGKDRLKISAAMRYMQQTSSEQLESLDLSPVRLYRENMAFLLAKMCIKVGRLPSTAEKLILGTAAVETRGPRFVREFFIDSARGERLVSAYTLWILFDPSSRKILRPSSFPYALPFEASITGGVVGDTRIQKAGGDWQTKMQVEIRYSHLDTNSHVNNSIYADFVCDALPFERLDAGGIDALAINFHSEARRGDVLDITTTEIGGSQYHVCGRRGENVCFDALAVLKD